MNLCLEYQSEYIFIMFLTAWSVRIQSYSSPRFLAFGLNTERYGVSSQNAGKYGPE